jgi:hypothetical protein
VEVNQEVLPVHTAAVAVKVGCFDLVAAVVDSAAVVVWVMGMLLMSVPLIVELHHLNTGTTLHPKKVMARIVSCSSVIIKTI